MKTDHIICLVGASGSGKTTIAEAAARGDVIRVLDSHTTRPQRFPGETGHIFDSQEEFDAIRDQLGAYTTFNGYEYGATHDQIDNHELYIIDPSGMEYMRQHRPAGSYTVVWIQSSEEARFNRMVKTRGHQKAQERIEHDREMYADAAGADYIMINESDDDLGECIMQLCQMCKEIFDKEGEVTSV